MTHLKKALTIIGAFTVAAWIVAAVAFAPCLMSGTCELTFITEEKP